MGILEQHIERLSAELVTLRAQVERLQAGGGVELASSRTNRVYLAGPMTGYPEFNFPAFNAAAETLRAEGLDVVNPAEHGIVEGATWADYLRFDIAKIAGCESMAFLPGWSKSKGARLEAHVGHALGMPMRFLDGAETAPVAVDELASIVQQFLSVYERSSAHLGEMMRDAGVTSVTVPGKHGELLAENEALVIRARAALAARAGQVAASAMVPFDLICNAIDKADDITMEGDYMLDSDDCIRVVRVMQALIEINGLTVGGKASGGAE